MNNNYILKFINSKDIRKYLQEINYQFSGAEYAFLIWQCRELSISERHSEFNTFLETTKTCLIKSSVCLDGWDLH